MTLSEPPLGAALAAAGAGALNILAKFGVNLATQSMEDRARASVPDAEALLRNHDLSLLVSVALDRAIRSAEDAPAHEGRLLAVKLRDHRTLVSGGRRH